MPGPPEKFRPDEIARLDRVIESWPPGALRQKTCVVMLRAGMRITDAVHAPRSGFSAPSPEYPAQLVYPCKTGQETTILTRRQGETIAAYLRAHDSALILPGMPEETALNLLRDLYQRAGVRNLSSFALRNTVRGTALRERIEAEAEGAA